MEKIDKVRSALGVTYKTELHFAVGHMRRWDGAYPDLTNGTKAVDLMAGEKVPRCVVLGFIWWVPFFLPSGCVRYALHKSDPFYGYWFYRFYYEAFADPLSKLSSKFVPETDEAVDELLSFEAEM